MDLAELLPLLLGLAWLLPLVSFALIVLFGPRMGHHGRGAAWIATGAIVSGFVLSTVALGLWLAEHPVAAASHGEHAAHSMTEVAAITGDWYTLAQLGSMRLSIGYHIDALTLAMFFMVTLVASCIHVYSMGYMHEELHDVTDALVLMSTGQPLKRRGRFHRFFQYLSLFCFSMLGLVIAGNVFMVFAFWELVGICSYFLIGFYHERQSASNAANKAFIVNRVGDFGFIIGLMALWGGLGTFAFDEIFAQVRPGPSHELVVPDGMVRLAAREQAEEIYRTTPDAEAAETAVKAALPGWRAEGYGYGLLVIAGLGIFCGCVGKSAQFPLHVWLPDAMEGPTPVSALIHAATMVAAGVYLVGRAYPIFTAEVLIVIAIVGAITLFIAATIAITATDIKRVLAYSTVSQLGYMMLALGLGGWVAGLFHLLTHAFFKSLLFLCSGSVIHATGTNEMPLMGGLRKKMPWTATTMLIGCLAISGAGVPLLIGFSGYYSKDAILAQAFSFRSHVPAVGWLFFVAAGGAAITAFYMFRLWFLTFAGQPRDEHIYAHAHESPRVMTIPLVILAVMAVIAGWTIPGIQLGLPTLLEQARPLGTIEGLPGGAWWPTLAIPAESLSHEPHLHHLVSIIAFTVALVGFLVAMAYYGLRLLNPETARRKFLPIHYWLWNKWFFDQMYHYGLVMPILAFSKMVAEFDRRGIDAVVDGSARLMRGVSLVDDLFDRVFVDGAVNLIARATHAAGVRLRSVQTGRLRQYVMFLAVGTVALFVLISLYWGW